MFEGDASDTKSRCLARRVRAFARTGADSPAQPPSRFRSSPWTDPDPAGQPIRAVHINEALQRAQGAPWNEPDLIEAYVNQGVLEELKLWTPERGTPQGAVISPLLANVYLHPVDVAMRTAGYKLIRYADDMVVLCRTRQEAEAALAQLDVLLAARGLELHPDKTRLAHLMERPGYQFLGYVFYDKYRDPRQSSQDKLRASLRDKTELTNGHSLVAIISSLNVTLRGWFHYFKFCSANSWAWERIDSWVRFRLRAILDKRRRKGGRKKRRGRGHAHIRWPNAHFAEHGLFSLVSAVKLVRQW